MRTRAELIGNATHLRAMVEDGDFGPPFDANGEITFAGGIWHMSTKAATDPDWQRWPLERRAKYMEELRRLAFIFKRGGIEAVEREFQE